MAVPTKWNMTGKKWNSGLTWNGLTTTSSTMKIKAIIDFTSYTAAELGPVAQTIHDQMTLHAAHFPTPPISMAALQTLITTYNQKLVARASRASVDVLAFNLARHDLEVALHDLGGYVNLVAKGEPMLVTESGFPSYGGTQASLPAIPGAPTDLRLRNGDLSRSIVARCRPDRSPSTSPKPTPATRTTRPAGRRRPVSAGEK